MPASPVLDSFALLAFLRDEPGSEQVAAILEKAGEREQPVHMTEVNYAEVQYIVRRKDGEAAWRVVSGELVAMPIEFHPADRQLADLAADFKTRYKLSLADCFAAALAKTRNAELVTGDPEFKAIAREIGVTWLK
jgi:predicted nucleic acid-binding protein